jgi:arylsulfatase A-like enzyme
MNILYLHTHDSGRYWQPYGYDIPMPNLMNLTAQGVIFRQAFSAAPTCSASRTGLLTGMNPHAAGMIGLAHRGFALHDPTQHLAHFLAENGYETVLCGVQHEIAHGRETQLGYQKVLRGELPPEPAGPRTLQQQLTRRAEQDFANAQAAAAYLHQPKTRPFFISVGFVETHFDLPDPAPDINPANVQPPPTLPDNAITRRDMAGYITMARRVDHCFGEVLQALDDSGLAEDTLVICTTDHGIAFPKMKCTLYDTGIGVALILRFPRRKYAGQSVDALVSHLDIFPTLCELTSLPCPAWLEGHSLLPLLDGHTAGIRDEIFADVTYHAAYEPMRCIRTERYKYIRYFGSFDRMVRPNIDGCPSKDFLLEAGLLDQPHDPPEMLFDLYADPAERVNLAASPAHAHVRADLAARLQRWMEATDDPLRQGDVPLPPGAFANRRAGLHPGDQDYE